ncbi:MAG: hypothetical protein H7328_13505 [Bdellovibrio sp.]|nr:hypothetical protein [Bdellovibrio sp.]
MKLLVIALLLVSSVSFADVVVETGTYKAVDADTGTINTTLIVRADNTVNFNVKTPDFEMPAPGCEGTYAVLSNILVADMSCPMEGLEKIQVKIDITHVTAENIRSATGANVDVMIDALGADAYKFFLKIIE